jgi:hypothetical protein
MKSQRGEWKKNKIKFFTSPLGEGQLRLRPDRTVAWENP